MVREKEIEMARRKTKGRSAAIRIDDIDWSGIAKALSSNRMNAKETRQEFCPQITAPTFKKWAESPAGLGAKYSIDWGRVGKGNYIRIHERDQAESDILRKMAELVTTHGMLACVRALAEVSSGTRR